MANAGNLESGLSKASVETLLCELAGSDYDVLRLKAIQGLRDMKSSVGAKVFVEALKDDDEDVRVDAASALASYNSPPVIAAVLENLEFDPCADVKLACVTTLAALKADAALPVLRQLVVGRGENIVWDEDQFYQDEWDAWLDIQIAAIRALGTLKDSDGIAAIVSAVNDEEAQDLDDVATRAFAQMGVAALPVLESFLKSGERRRRFYTVKALGHIEGEEALGLLKSAIKDEAPSIRLAAFEGLFEKVTEIELYEKALKDKHEDIRVCVLSRLKLDDWQLMDRVMKDPSQKVQLALAGRFDHQVICTSREDVSFKILDILLRSDYSEVGAVALGVLAARCPDLVQGELKDAFATTSEDKDGQERLQWAVVDGLSRSRHALAMDWLQQAISSPFRSVRLKALAVLGGTLGDVDVPSKQRETALEMIVNFAAPASKPEAMEEDANEERGEIHPQDQREELKAAGLDIGDEPNEEDAGPTSSLGAILGHEEIAAEMVSEAEEEKVELSAREQALLARATRNLSRRKVSLDGDQGALDREVQLTALRLLGEQKGYQSFLAELGGVDDGEAAAAALTALHHNMEVHGCELESTVLSDLLVRSLGSTSANIRLQALRLLTLSGLKEDRFIRSVRQCLSDEVSAIRAQSLSAWMALGQSSQKAETLINDSSPLVRQHSMRMLCKTQPELAAQHLCDFISQNPEQSLATYLGEEEAINQRIGLSLAERLKDESYKRNWPVLVPALAQIYSKEVPHA
ncbi:HEAT repeat domain-containing protein [Flexibacterium corallicola]|uniref:HEAT repeat domain-containing protein n=1 Tax=Flexibacterium corallicola TaxID=3037259 RepID=UPI00286F6BE1|nr:HEAT repeat domain-containing protein [Pseudovibrio sp. M1P-2-3]